MTADPFERRVPALLDELSLPSVPDYFDDILGQTAGMRQRPGWTFPERWLPMDITLQAPAGVRVPPWRIVGLVALLALVIAVVLVAIGTPRHQPAPLFGPAANGSIVFARNGDLYAADSALTTQEMLLGGGTEEYAATFSNDGLTLYFGRRIQNGVIVMAANPDGTNPRELATLVPEPSAVALDPAGLRLAVIQVRSGLPTLAIVDLAHEGRVQSLALGTLVPEGFVAWRPPSAEELVFTAAPAGDPNRLGLYRVRADGQQLTPLAIRSGELHGGSDASQLQISFQEIQLSDDGAVAAFWNWEPRLSPGRSCSVHFVDLAVGGDQRVTYDPDAACELAPHFLANGGVVLERQDSQGYANVAVASGAPGESFRPIGPTFHYKTRAGWTLSPDRTEVLLVPTTGVSELISIASGQTIQTKVNLPEVGSWQRLAP